MYIPHVVSTGGMVDTITVFDASRSNPILVADSNHPHWNEILRGVEAGDESVFELFDVSAGILRKFRQITDRVSWNGSEVLWDGDPVHSVLADQLARALAAGESNYEALAKFWEKLESNPNEHSKEQAYNWLATHDFKITLDGDVVAYKGVNSTRDPNVFKSTAASRVEDIPSAFVDGEPVAPRSRVPNKVGTVVTMPRSEVKHDPNQTCERGLHVGDWSYAKCYGDAVLEVHVNPRDIVSVPVDAMARKVRVCRYKVVQRVSGEYSGGPVLKPEPTYAWAGNAGYAPQS